MNLQDVLNEVKADAPFVAKAAEVLFNIAKVMPGSGTAIEAFTLAAQIANGVANSVPTLIATYDDIKTAVAGGAPVSDDQWVSWRANVDAAHVSFVEAAQKVANGAS